MQLQGPGAGRSLRFRAATGQLRGVGGAIVLHPLATIAGLALGGYLAYKKIDPFAFLRHGTSARVWGSQRMSVSRSKALSGRKRRRR
jgi:hypothetical protein